MKATGRVRGDQCLRSVVGQRRRPLADADRGSRSKADNPRDADKLDVRHMGPRTRQWVHTHKHTPVERHIGGAGGERWAACGPEHQPSELWRRMCSRTSRRPEQHVRKRCTFPPPFAQPMRLRSSHLKPANNVGTLTMMTRLPCNTYMPHLSELSTSPEHRSPDATSTN